MSRLFIVGALAVTCGTSLLYRESLAHHISLTAGLAVLVGLLSVIAIVEAQPDRPWTLGSSFAILLALFHMGLLPMVAVTGRAATFYESDRYWLVEPQFGMAIVSVIIAQSAFSSGYLLCLHVRGRPAEAIERSAQASTTSGALSLIAPSLLLGGVLAWFGWSYAAGVSFLATNYPEFLAATSQLPMSWAYLAMGLGFASCAACPEPWVRRLAVTVFGFFSVVAFPLGLRGEVLIPLAAYGVVASRQRSNSLTGRRLAALLLLAMALGSLVRVVRLKGLQAASYSWSDANPLNGLTELGYSIRPLTAVHGYHDVNHEPFVGMATYLAPFQRIVVGQILGQPVTPIELDTSVFSTTMSSRIGAVGGSIVAEAYRSGGSFAVIVLMALFGVCLAVVDASPARSPLASALVGMGAFIVLLWLRNDFTPVPVQIAAALVLTASAVLLSSSKSSRRSVTYRRVSG